LVIKIKIRNYKNNKETVTKENGLPVYLCMAHRGGRNIIEIKKKKDQEDVAKQNGFPAYDTPRRT